MANAQLEQLLLDKLNALGSTVTNCATKSDIEEVYTTEGQLAQSIKNLAKKVSGDKND